MRDFDKVKEKREFALEGRHVSGLIIGSLVLALCTFAVGYVMGQQAVRPVTVKGGDVWETLMRQEAPEKKSLYTFEKELHETNSIAPAPLPMATAPRSCTCRCPPRTRAPSSPRSSG